MDINESQFQDFLALSVALTGFSEFHLLGTGQAKMYFTTVSNVIGKKTMNKLLKTFHGTQAKASNDTKEFNKLFRASILSDEKLGPIARNIIKLWFVGSWYQLPQAWRETFGVRDNDVTFVVSATAYMEGLLWPAVGAHPSGAKAPGYGTWSARPDIPKI